LDQHVHEGDKVILDYKEGDERPTVHVEKGQQDSPAETSGN